MAGISIFDIFKIGVGPSSSHTLGPWMAAKDFVANLDSEIDQIKIHLYGSLSKTGKGHATDIALILGLSSFDPQKINVDKIDDIINEIASSRQIQINDKAIHFSADDDIIFESKEHPRHPNTLIFKSYKNGTESKVEIYASVGGGFIEKEESSPKGDNGKTIRYPIQKGKDLINITDELECSISDLVLKNEVGLRPEKEVKRRIQELVDVMLECVFRGCRTEGILPGGLNVKRRARRLYLQLIGSENDFENRVDWVKAIKRCKKEFNEVNKWISCFALAVNEENAAMRRVVTSPTNGAAGVIPAVLLYYFLFCDYNRHDGLERFLLTAGEIGSLFKKGATISAAVGGCQAEIGVSSSMAAAGLTEVLGGNPRQVLMAAEIAMEHHLGMTCDPVGGLVQIPCIERNAMGAIKAITASNLALSSDPNDAKVDIDTIIKTMWDTAQEMNGKYKETAEGGLAFNLPVFYPEC